MRDERLGNLARAVEEGGEERTLSKFKMPEFAALVQGAVRRARELNVKDISKVLRFP